MISAGAGWARRVPRVVFPLYAVVIFLLTHWPGVKVEGPMPRADLWAHLGAFGLWGFLFGCTAWLGPPETRRGFLRALLAGGVYTAIDESLQLIPALARVAAWDDWLANVAGVLLGLLAAGLLGRWAARRARSL
ncbi:MAG: VanZ family protein [Planctomycetota bacterium]|nr:VanZ family protein [Planctomycetota bacterium]